MSTLSEQALPQILHREPVTFAWRTELRYEPRHGEGTNIDACAEADLGLTLLDAGDEGKLASEVAPWWLKYRSYGLGAAEIGSRTYAAWSIEPYRIAGHTLLGVPGCEEAAEDLRKRTRAYLAFLATTALPVHGREITDQMAQKAPGVLVSDGQYKDTRAQLSVSAIGQRAYDLKSIGHLWRSGMNLTLAQAIGLSIRYDSPDDWYSRLETGVRHRWPSRHPYLLTTEEAGRIRSLALTGSRSALEGVLPYLREYLPDYEYTIRRTTDGVETVCHRVIRTTTPGLTYGSIDKAGTYVFVAHDEGHRSSVTTGICELSQDHATVYSTDRPAQRFRTGRVPGDLVWELRFTPDGCSVNDEPQPVPPEPPLPPPPVPPNPKPRPKKKSFLRKILEFLGLR